MTELAGFLSGWVAMAYAVAGIFFLRFWTRSRDGLFLGFAIAFILLALNQTLVGIFGDAVESQTAYYLLRLLAFLIIIFAIVRKNVGK
jgi:hypothetical protein